MDDPSKRMTRLEDALVDFATLVAEGTIARPSLFVGAAAEDAGERFAAFVGPVRRESGQSRMTRVTRVTRRGCASAAAPGERQPAGSRARPETARRVRGPSRCSRK